MCFILCLKGKCCRVCACVSRDTEKKVRLQHKRQLSPVQFASIPLSTEGHKNRVTVSYEAAILGNDFIMLNFALKITVLSHWYFWFWGRGWFWCWGHKKSLHLSDFYGVLNGLHPIFLGQHVWVLMMSTYSSQWPWPHHLLANIAFM